jgi:nitroreductase
MSLNAGSDSPNDRFAAIEEIIRARRTSMLVDHNRPVDYAIIEELCALASWAPNHKRTWPWRFAVLTGDARSRLGTVVADAMAAHGDDPARVEKARTKYERTPTIVIVGSIAGETETRTVENRDATAVAVQNFMLGATARRLATYWGSCPRGANEPVAQLCGFDSGTAIVSMLYVGWATSTVSAPPRPEPIINYFDQ